MPIIYLKLKDQSQNVDLQSILGAYGHLAWVRTEGKLGGIVTVIPTEDTIEETKEVLRALSKEIEFEEVDI